MTNDTRPSTSVRLLLVDDDKAFRQSLSILLTDEGFHVVGEAGTGEDAVRLAQSIRLDIVLMDICLPGMDGVRATAEVLKVAPRSQVVGLSLCGDGDTVSRMMMAGASAFVPKTKLESLLGVLHGMAEVLASHSNRKWSGTLVGVKDANLRVSRKDLSE